MDLINKRLQCYIKNMLMPYKLKKYSTIFWQFLFLFSIIYICVLIKDRWFYPTQTLGHTAVAYSEGGKEFVYNSHTSPMIFIGGHPRSGTTLMRAMLDAHNKVRCGEESRIIPRIVQMRDNWLKSENERNRLVQAGIDEKVMNAAISSFILETIAQHGEPSEVLCNKDPLVLKSGTYITELFPNSKWLFMMRDGRAVIHSVMSRKVTISGYKLDDHRQCLGKWNTVVSNMETQCNDIGPKRCMLVYYEQLVLHPKRWMTMILDFLDLPWDESVLHHEQLINKPGGIRVSQAERSSDQIIKPINIDALTSWVGFYPEDVLEEMDELAPMLQKFGYDPSENDPNYGVPDGQVVNNTNIVHQHQQEWENKAKKLIAEMKKEGSFD